MDPITLIVIIVIIALFFGGPRVYPSGGSWINALVGLLVLLLILRVLHLI